MKIIILCIVFLLVSSTALCCVGRVLTIGVQDSIEQRITGELVSTYITERTGTTVNIVPVLDSTICNTTINIVFLELNTGLSNIDCISENKQKDYAMVKQHYMELDIVWLKPIGYSMDSLIIPVTTVEVLNRFPVLDRVINKLNVTDHDIRTLINESKTEDISVVVRRYLKEKNLI